MGWLEDVLCIESLKDYSDLFHGAAENMVTDAEISGKIITLCLKTCHRKSRGVYKKVSIKSKFLWNHSAKYYR